MTQLNAGSKAKDNTYGTLDSTIWTAIEANTAIICACMPMLKAPLTAICPRLLPRTFPSASAGRRDVEGSSTPLSTLENGVTTGGSGERRRHSILSPKKNGKKSYGRLGEEEVDKKGGVDVRVEGHSSGSSKYDNDDEDRIGLAKGDSIPTGYISKTVDVDARSDHVGGEGRPF